MSSYDGNDRGRDYDRHDEYSRDHRFSRDTRDTLGRHDYGDRPRDAPSGSRYGDERRYDARDSSAGASHSSTRDRTDRTDSYTASAPPTALAPAPVPAAKAAVLDSAVLSRVTQAQSAAQDLSAKPVYLTKAERQALALQRLEQRRVADGTSASTSTTAAPVASAAAPGAAAAAAASLPPARAPPAFSAAARAAAAAASAPVETAEEAEARRMTALVRREYFGDNAFGAAPAVTASTAAAAGNKKQQQQKSAPGARRAGGSLRDKLKFDWDLTDDTSLNESDPLYLERHTFSVGFGRGHLAGVDAAAGGAERYRRAALAVAARARAVDAAAAAGNAGAGAGADIEEVLAGAATSAAGAGTGVGAMYSDDAPAAVAAARAAKARARADRAHALSRRWEEKSLSEMEDRDWRIFREEFDITTHGARVPPPLRFWRESGLPEPLLAAIAAAGFREPSKIQRAAIPVGLANRDVVGIAETGSGKTLAFLLPLFVYVMRQPRLTAQLAREEGPYAVIMAPTRELAQQITSEAEKFGRSVGIRAVSIVGGQSIEEQGFNMREGCEIIVATPGRLLECLSLRLIVLNQCNYIVLDEADRMLDLGFEHQIQAVMDAMPSTNLRPTDEALWDARCHYRQTIMFSATMPLKVELLAKKHLRNPVFIAIGGREGKTADSVTQRIEWVPTETQKKSRLVSVLRAYARDRAIVFCNRKVTCDAIGRYLAAEFAPSTHTPAVVHSGKTQDAREGGLNAFKSGAATVLVTTDVMSRGIDVSGVRVVINYDMPEGMQAFKLYTHRIGRTGRGGAEGDAVSFVCDSDKDIMYDLVKNLTEAKVSLPPQVRGHPMARAEAKMNLQFAANAGSEYND
jgi:ATP-dependent RNA helicase DDX23/PRP28